MSDPLAWLRGAATHAEERLPTDRRTSTSEPSPLNHPMAWADHGACVGMDPDLFYVVDGIYDQAVIEVCRRCPVVAECLDWALHHENDGYWGGQTERARRRLRRTAGIRIPIDIEPDPITLGDTA